MLTTFLSVLIVLIVLVLFVAALMIFRATIFGRVPDRVEALDPQALLAVDGQIVAEHLAAVLRLPTVSEQDHSKIDYAAFKRLHASLEALYPRLHATLTLAYINQYSLLYTWVGSAPDLEPAALLGHLDVVPADSAEWTHPPFSGTIQDGFVWGRGALDIKSTVITVMEAVEGLIKAGYQPERTLYLAFGHDEEISGLDGARCIVDALQQRGVKLSAVLDEGGMITLSTIPGVTVPVALVGLAEKGHVSVEMLVEGRAGHSSMPPRHTSIGVLARAVTRVEEHPMPERLSMARLMFTDLGPFLPFSLRLALANTWLFKGLVRKRLSAVPSTNALIRTTTAATLIQGGAKENVLPAQAQATINCRLLPGDTRETILTYLRKVIDDEAVQIRSASEFAWDPSPVSPVDSPAYQNLSRAIRQVFPEVAVSPYLVVAATDARYYAAICPNVYRFAPYIIDEALLKTIHGIDERISVDNLARMAQFYAQLIKTWTAAA